MSAVNSPRECVICGRVFYPSMSGSFFVCDNPQCKKDFEDVQESTHNNGEAENDDNE